MELAEGVHRFRHGAGIAALLTVVFMAVCTAGLKCWTCTECDSPAPLGPNQVANFKERHVSIECPPGYKCKMYTNMSLVDEVWKGCGKECLPHEQHCYLCDQEDYCNRPFHCLYCNESHIYYPCESPNYVELCRWPTVSCYMGRDRDNRWLRGCGTCDDNTNARQECEVCYEDMCNRHPSCYECDHCNIIDENAPIENCERGDGACSEFNVDDKYYRRCGTCATNEDHFKLYDLGQVQNCTQCYITDACNVLTNPIICLECSDNGTDCIDAIREKKGTKCYKGYCMTVVFAELPDRTFRTCGTCRDGDLSYRAAVAFGFPNPQITLTKTKCYQCPFDMCNSIFPSDMEPTYCDTSGDDGSSGDDDDYDDESNIIKFVTNPGIIKDKPKYGDEGGGGGGGGGRGGERADSLQGGQYVTNKAYEGDIFGDKAGFEMGEGGGSDFGYEGSTGQCPRIESVNRGQSVALDRFAKCWLSICAWVLRYYS